MTQDSLDFNTYPQNPFKYGTQNWRLYERLKLGPATNYEIMKDLHILNNTHRQIVRHKGRTPRCGVAGKRRTNRERSLGISVDGLRAEMVMQEEWKVIEDYPDYAVSNHGRVKRLTTRTNTFAGKIIRMRYSGKNYSGFTICRNGLRKTVQVHPLVAHAFIGPRPEGFHINHIDGHKGNPHVSNLEYVTVSENNLHAYRTGLRSPQNGEQANGSKLLEQDVLQIIKLREQGESCSLIAAKFSVTDKEIFNIITGQRWGFLTGITPSSRALSRGAVKVKFMPIQMVCEICGTEYTGYKNNRKTCSYGCQRKTEAPPKEGGSMAKQGKDKDKDKDKDIFAELEVAKKEGANLLMPSTHIAGLSEFHAPVVERVFLSAKPDDGDVYPHDKDGKKFRLTKQALMKLSVCAGVIWSVDQTRRIDNGQHRDYIAYQAVGGLRKADGQPVFFKAEYDVDFEIVEAELREQYEAKAQYSKDKTAQQKADYVDFCVKRDLLQKRKHRLKLAEAGAMNRVLRMLLGVKNAYTPAELAQPFVTIRIVFRPDYSDKEVRAKLLDASLLAMTGIYGQNTGAVTAGTTVPPMPEPIDVTAIPNGDDQDDDGHDPLPTPQSPATPDAQSSQLTDFENCDEVGQCKALTDTARQKGYDLAGYQGRLKKSLGELTATTRAKLFVYLLALPDKAAAVVDDDIPF